MRVLDLRILQLSQTSIKHSVFYSRKADFCSVVLIYGSFIKPTYHHRIQCVDRYSNQPQLAQSIILSTATFADLAAVCIETQSSPSV